MKGLRLAGFLLSLSLFQTEAYQAGWCSMAAAGSRTYRPSPARSRAEVKEEYFSKEGPSIRFGSRQSVIATLPQAPLDDVQAYLLEDPGQVVGACWDRTSTNRLSDEVFRLKLKTIKVLGLEANLAVDVRLWADGQTLRAESVGTHLADLGSVIGSDFADSIKVDMKGDLVASQTVKRIRSLELKQTTLTGNIDCIIGGSLPSPIDRTPERLVRAATLQINNSVLSFISEYFVKSLAADYHSWATARDVPSAPAVQ
ncbi:unnamed protein product [Chrysoparadoxa australica]